MTGRILIADDDENFSRSTSELLNREGFECAYTFDAESAQRMLKSSEYDLLIADINMPGNTGLELIRGLPQIVEGMPVILVTGSPSIETATSSIHLPVAAYLTKPFDYEELLSYVRNAINKYRTYLSVCSINLRLLEWQQNLASIKESLGRSSEEGASVPINTFFKLTFRNIAESLLDLEHLIAGLDTNSDKQFVCNLLDCPSLTKMKEGLTETIEVLMRTREAFKSKDLAKLRFKLEKIIKEVR